jgi:hypothetical protein
MFGNAEPSDPSARADCRTIETSFLKINVPHALRRNKVTADISETASAGCTDDAPREI